MRKFLELMRFEITQLLSTRNVILSLIAIILLLELTPLTHFFSRTTSFEGSLERFRELSPVDLTILQHNIGVYESHLKDFMQPINQLCYLAGIILLSIYLTSSFSDALGRGEAETRLSLPITPLEYFSSKFFASYLLALIFSLTFYLSILFTLGLPIIGYGYVIIGVALYLLIYSFTMILIAKLVPNPWLISIPTLALAFYSLYSSMLEFMQGFRQGPYTLIIRSFAILVYFIGHSISISSEHFIEKIIKGHEEYRRFISSSIPPHWRLSNETIYVTIVILIIMSIAYFLLYRRFEVKGYA